jgi:hypothetical protein
MKEISRLIREQVAAIGVTRRRLALQALLVAPLSCNYRGNMARALR